MTMPPPDPAVQARLWDFIVCAREGTAEDGPDMFTFGCQLIGMWEVAFAMYYAKVKDVTRADADAAVGEMVEAQRLLWGSLAAMAAEPPVVHP